MPGFSRKKVATEIVKRFKEQLKGNDLVARWDTDTFSVFLPHTPEKVAGIVEQRLTEIFSNPFTYGVEDTEQVNLEALLAAATCNSEDGFESFVKDAEAGIKAREL